MNTRDRLTGGRAVIAARDADAAPDTTEIRRLATAAGYDVVGEVTQRRAEDRRYNLGSGKAEELAAVVEDTGADAVVFDGSLSPGQYADLLDALPAGTTLVDRYRLVLDIFAEGAGSAAARTQVRLATLRYELPRLERMEGESALNRAFFEKGSPVLDAKRRIDALDAKLDDLTDAAADRRERRREEGFDLVALAGYTNAGKSTLLRRLADELDGPESEGGVEGSADGDGNADTGDGATVDHADLATTASVEDRLFETLETTTRRATVDGRRLLLTDTVGLVADLPHDIVRSFSATLDEIRASDVVCAVVDASADAETLERRLETTVDVLAADADGPVVPVVNKIDRVDAGERDVALERVERVLADAAVETRDPVAVSARDGDGCDDLRAAVLDALPSETAAFVVPNSGETQALVSWLHERGNAEVTYGGETVEIRFTGRPAVVEEARRRATALRES